VKRDNSASATESWILQSGEIQIGRPSLLALQARVFNLITSHVRHARDFNYYPAAAYQKSSTTFIMKTSFLSHSCIIQFCFDKISLKTHFTAGRDSFH